MSRVKPSSVFISRGHDLHRALAVGIDRVGGLAQRAQHRLQRVGALLDHLAAGHHAGVHVQPVHLAFLARDEAPVAGEVDLAAALLDRVEDPRRPGGHGVDVALGQRGHRVGRREIHELDLAEVDAGVTGHGLDGHRHRGALGHPDLQLLEVLRRADDLLPLLAQHDLLRAGDVALGRDVVDRLPGGGDGHDHRRGGGAEVDVAGAPHRRQVGARDVPARVDLEALGLEVARAPRRPRTARTSARRARARRRSRFARACPGRRRHRSGRPARSVRRAECA